MTDGDYFPNWPGTVWTEEKNLDFIRILVKDGGPIRDTYVDDDGLPIDDDPNVDTTLDKERKVIEEGGFEWDETIPGWKVPDGYVWDDEEKKWKPAQ